MKVVLFCGGYGMRMRNGAGRRVPKPMQMVGPRPLIWHVMRYYAHFGHKEFILCLGYGARAHQGVLPQLPGDRLQRLRAARRRRWSCCRTDITDWTITFVDTGIESPIGERLRRVRESPGR